MKRLTCTVLFIFFFFSFVCFSSYANEPNQFTLVVSEQGGQEIRIIVSGKGVTDLYAYEAVISFDKEALELSGVTSGIKGFSVSPKIKGNKLIIGFTKVGNVPGEKGNITLSTVTFRSRKTGTSKVKLESVTVVDSKLTSKTYLPGNEVSVSHKGNIYRPEIYLSSDGSAVTASLTEQNLEKMFSEAEPDENGIKTVEVEITEGNGSNTFIQNIPASLFADETVNKRLVIRTPAGKVCIPGNIMKKEWIEGAEQLSVIIRKVDASMLDDPIKEQIGDKPVIKLGMLVDGNEFQWSKTDAVVQVTIPYYPSENEAVNHEHIVVWYVDGDQNVIPVPTGRYNPDLNEITFVTNHFSIYAVNYVEKTFDDIQNHWSQKYVEVMASKGVIKGYSDKVFGVQDNITRADYLTLLIRALGITTEVDDNFTDVEEDKYYYETLGIAKKLGIVNTKDNLFRPNEPITREDMMVFTASVLNYSNGNIYHGSIDDLKQFTDTYLFSPEAVESVAVLVKEGIIVGNRNELFPKNNLTRAEAATVLYRMYNKLWNNWK